MHLKGTTLEKNDAVLLGLAVIDVTVTTQVSEVVGEELPHALFIALLFILHVSHEALRFGVSVWSFQEHA